MAHPNAHPVVTMQGGLGTGPTLLGQGPARIPTGGKIRAGIKVLTKKAADEPKAQAIYEQGVAAGQSFEQIERAITAALPDLKTPLVPRNVPWFTVRAQDFPNPEIARQILEAFGEDRGEGRRLYRFPVVFPSDHWQTVMPHELAAWGTHEKHYWSQYSPDGRVRHCLCHAPVPVDDSGRRTIRLFGGRKTMLREDNGGRCEPEACHEYQQRQCNLTGRFLFFIPGIRSISAFELHTNSFYAMNAAIQKFETVAFLRGGRLSGFLDRERTPFYLTKTLKEVAHIDEQGRAVRMPQWIIDLEAPVDVTALLRDGEDAETTLVQAQLASQLLQGEPTAARRDLSPGAPESPSAPTEQALPEEAPLRDGCPTLEQLMARAQAFGIVPEHYQAYTDRRWGRGWKLNPHGRARAWDELERYQNDPQGYRDKIETELQRVSSGRPA
jgi:recombination directionality factor gp3-like protein